MKITEEKKDDIVICKVQGEVNLDTSPDLRKKFDSFISSNTKKIIINFSDVPYIDSSGLATLIELLQRLRKIDGKFRICNMSEKVRSIFPCRECILSNEICGITFNRSRIFCSYIYRNSAGDAKRLSTGKDGSSYLCGIFSCCIFMQGIKPSINRVGSGRARGF